MKVKIKFEVPDDDNDPDMDGYNVRTIIYELAKRIRRGYMPSLVLDGNGNSIGQIEVSDD